MSLHKLSAGHGDDYLIRQVAALDATHRGRTMRLLFAEGRHPLAETSPGGGQVLALGVPYRPSTGEQPFQAALRTRFADHNTALGVPRRANLPAPTRARLRGQLAAEWFRQQEGATRRVTWSWRRRWPGGPARRRRRSQGMT